MNLVDLNGGMIKEMISGKTDGTIGEMTDRIIVMTDMVTIGILGW